MNPDTPDTLQWAIHAQEDDAEAGFQQEQDHAKLERNLGRDDLEMREAQMVAGNEMEFAGILTDFAALMLSIGNVRAVPSGKTVEFASPMGKVNFDGKAHADKSLKCADSSLLP